MARQHEHTDVNASTGPVAGGIQSVVVHGEGVRVDRVDTELPRVEARSRFGGVDPMGILAGTMAALGTLALLSSLAGALGRIGYEQGAGDDQLSTAGIVAGLLVLGLSLLFGGYVAGRVARYEGKRNGLLTGMAFVALCALLAALASSIDRLRDLALPRFLDAGDLSVAALASAVTALLVALCAAVLGGRFGAAYHRRVDDALLSTRAGGLTPYPTDTDTGTTSDTTARQSSASESTRVEGTR